MLGLTLDLRNSGGAPSCGPKCAESLGATRMSLMHQGQLSLVGETNKVS